MAAGRIPLEEAVHDPDDESSPVVRILVLIFADAVKRGASHIHIDPDDAGATVRLRVDGQLHEVLRLPRTVLAALTGRLKGISRLDIAERGVPQHGRFTLEMDGQSTAFTIETIPLGNLQERIVLHRIYRSSDG
jgi:type II secretory ATPase GspE/PulE/Tfp pilus assembly ATPase PilB-like protein